MTIRRTLLAGLAAVATIVVAPAAASASIDPYDETYDPYETCEYDDSIPADSSDCYLPCEYDASIPADDPYCEEPTTTTSTTTTTEAPTTTEATTTTTSTTTSTTSTTTSTTVAPVAAPAAPAAAADPADPAPAVLEQSGRQPAVLQAGGQQLPATGTDNTLVTTLIALAFLVGGVALVATTRRKHSA